MHRREFFQRSVIATLASSVLADKTLARALQAPAGAPPAAPLATPRALTLDSYSRFLNWLRTPDASLHLGSAETRAAIRADVEAALEALPDWQAFARGAQHTRNRIGMLACGSPADALNVLKIEERAVPGRADTDTPEGRQAFLRTAVANELIGFMLSPAYEAAFAPDPEEPT